MAQNTVYVGNLSENVTEELLYELFLQAGPVVHVNIPKQKPFGFVQFKHQCSVPYVIKLLEGISLFGKTLKIAPPRGLCGPPMGPPHMVSMIPRPLIHPLSQHGRLGPVEPRNPRKGNRHNGDDRSDLREKLKSRSRPNDHMMPSRRPKMIESPTKNDMDAIPDSLGSGFDPLYTSGPRSTHLVAPYQLGGGDDRGRIRDDRNHRFEWNQDDGQHRRGRHEGHRQHDNPRHDRNPHHSSRRRKQF